MGERAGKVKRRRRRRKPGEVFLRDRVEYGLFRALAFLLRALPVETGSAFMGRALRILGPLTARHERALRNLSLVFPDLPERERRKIAAQQWENLGRTFAESFVIDRIVADPRRIEFAVSDEFDAKLRAPGGHVLVSMHSANWELAGVPGQRYRSVMALYQKLENPLANAFVARMRGHMYGAGLLPKAPDTAARVMQWVREGNSVAMLGDTREVRGVSVTFLGQPTLANPFPAMVARRLGSLLVAGHVTRLPRCRFRVDAVEIPVPVSDDSKADIKAATQAIQDYFEAAIRKRPGEWMWVQDRWSTDRRRRQRLRAQR